MRNRGMRLISGLLFFGCGAVACLASTYGRLHLTGEKGEAVSVTDYSGLIMMNRMAAMKEAEKEGKNTYSFTLPGNVILGAIPDTSSLGSK